MSAAEKHLPHYTLDDYRGAGNRLDHLARHDPSTRRAFAPDAVVVCDQCEIRLDPESLFGR